MSIEKTSISTKTALTTVLLTPLPWSSLQMGPLIGSGGYGDVYQATWEGKTVAVKQLHLKTLSADLTADFEREAKLMAQCQFSQVVKLYGVCQEPGRTVMVMEYLSKGSLYQVLHDSRETLPWNSVRWNIAIDIGKGLSYLHSRKILHRDLKSLNVLLDQDYRGKITDFGLAKIKLETNSTSTKTKQGMGTTRWRAPELFKRGASPTFASDVYSYGMVLWEIASRQLPFYDAIDEITVMGWIKEGEQEKITEDIPEIYAEMIKRTWESAEKRPKAEEIVLGLKKGRSKLEVSIPEFSAEEVRHVWGRQRSAEQPVYHVESAKVTGTAIGAVFKPVDKAYSRGWLGKLGYLRGLSATDTGHMAIHSLVRRSSALEAVVEKLAADCYRYLSQGNYRVPKTRLAELPIKNPYTERNPLTQVLYDEINEGRKELIDDGVYVLSKKVEGYQDLAELTVCVWGDEQKSFTVFLQEGKLPEYAIVEEKKLPLLGLMEILAAGRLLGDTDVLGGGGNNAGYTLEYDGRGEVIALRAVKIDPGFAFNFRGVENQFYQSQNPSAHNSNLFKQDKRNLQYGNLARALKWEYLTVSQQQVFIQALSKGLKALRRHEEVSKLVNREAFKQTPKKRVLPALSDVLGENGIAIEENLGWQEKTYANELKRWETRLDDVTSESVKTRARLAPIRLPKPESSSSKSSPKIISTSDVPTAFAGSDPSKVLYPTSSSSSSSSSYVFNSDQSPMRTTERKISSSPLVNQPTGSNASTSTSSLKSTTSPLTSTTTSTVMTATTKVTTSPSPLSSVFQSPPKAAPSDAEQVETMSKSVQSKINPQELTALLKWLTEGHLVEVEALLKNNPILGLGTGTVTDRSDRTFKNITVLQYAAWSLDAEMAELIIGYIGAHNTSIQLNALAKEPSRYSVYGASYDFNPLVTKTQAYVHNAGKWKWVSDNCRQYWQKEVGGEQHKCPAWLIYAWSEEGSDVAWTKRDPNRKIEREYDKHRLDWWFTENYNNGRGVGSNWAVERGQWRGITREGWHVRHPPQAVYDSISVLLLAKNRCETLQRLKANADSQLNYENISSTAAIQTVPTQTLTHVQQNVSSQSLKTNVDTHLDPDESVSLVEFLFQPSVEESAMPITSLGNGSTRQAPIRPPKPESFPSKGSAKTISTSNVPTLSPGSDPSKVLYPTSSSSSSSSSYVFNTDQSPMPTTERKVSSSPLVNQPKGSAAATSTSSVKSPTSPLTPTLSSVKRLPSVFKSLTGLFKTNSSESTQEKQSKVNSEDSAQDKWSQINSEDLKVLMKSVVNGNLEEVDKLLKKDPNLALASVGRVTDLSQRTFNNITALQYAAWALDVEMVKLIMQYIETRDTALQLKALETAPERYSQYGASYDFKGLVNKYQTYINNYRKWDYGKCCQYWQKEIAGEQRKCPAWLIYAWSEEGSECWLNPEQTIKRFKPDQIIIKRHSYPDTLYLWFKNSETEGWIRGTTRYIKKVSSIIGIELKMIHDRDTLSYLEETRVGILRQLKKNAEGKADSVPLSYVEQVEIASQSVQSKINQEDLKALLKWVTGGHLEEVEKLLKHNQSLGLAAGTVKDLSDRTFTNVTALQYAAWALDNDMCELIVKYLGEENSHIQLNALWEKPSRYSQYGEKYDVTPLMTKTRKYTYNYGKWPAEQAREYWQKEVAAERRKCPAWVIYAWSEKGSDFAWKVINFRGKMKRQYDKNLLSWWFTVLMGDNGFRSLGLYRQRDFYKTEDGETRLDFKWSEHCVDSDGRLAGPDNVSSASIDSYWPARSESVKSLNATIPAKLPSASHTATAARLNTPMVFSSELSTSGSSFTSPLSKATESSSKPVSVSLSYAEKVEAASQSVQAKINAEDLKALLKWVTEGHLEEVEKLLKKDPSLGLATGSVTDRSERTFKNITALQCAAWALDAEMAELIIGYLGAHNTSIQLRALANEPNCYSTHGASYDFSPLVTKTHTYVDNYAKWDVQKCEQYWQKEVGGEQRKCPAWLIYAWSEKGADVAWTKQDPNGKIKRKYEKHPLDWWFTEDYNSGRGVGTGWAVYRGGYIEFYCYMGKKYINWGREEMIHDLEFVSLVGKTRCETLQRLRANADSQLNQVTPTDTTVTTNITSKPPTPY